MAAERQQARTDKERLATIETEIGHLKESIEEVYRYLREEFSKMVGNQIEDLRARQADALVALAAKANCDDLSDLVKRAEDTEKRMRVVERNMWKAFGAIAVLVFLVPYVMGKLKIF